ncbi:choline dehydrogenase [Microbacterium terrae]|uniref:Alcohol dehydrogenase [acceptor] n=1 Tax=Microbacterium terrae TaxID=69369 RepID=A0A0M2HEP4_9MICO|nr:GMC family oxidoreductase N-terminal domain-containing protein [Microbacterium terrae]KJL42688.1 Alcohol dehydrogenase [acceptor] [Microbacterium terrae]MBP1078599.1 choline dehydrogenase [Microbacterium terrae]GLJ98000.1 putative GMC-type oxidoreductase [Microbacterium terrae]
MSPVRRAPAGALFGADGLEADYVVVGAGSAGAVVAARLSEDPAVSVLLLEAGGPDKALELHVPAAFSKLFRGENDWGYDTVPQTELEDRTVFWPRGKTLGGSSSLNAMMWVRGFAADYDEWAETAGDGWSWDALVPYFVRAEHTADATHPTQGTDGPQSIEHQRDPRPHTAAFLRAVREAGYPVTAPNLPSGQGFSQTMVTQHRGARASTADTYLKPARGRANLRIVTGAHVRKVTFEPAGTGGTDAATGAPASAEPQASGVYVEIDGITRHVRARREVVLAGGAVNTPQLLMLSGIGPAGHLADHGIRVLVDAPDVGANLQDHLVAGLAPAAPGGTLYDAEKPGELVSYLARRRGMLTSNVAEAYGFVRTEVAGRTGAPAELPDIEIIFAPVPYVGEGLVPTPAHGVTVGAILLKPRSRGTIRLASGDPHQGPVIDPAYLSDPDGVDAATLLAGLAACERLIDTDALRTVTTSEWVQPAGGEQMSPAERAELSMRRYSHTLYHPVGTARMGTDAASVVDPELRVRGVGRLRVVDASVMPTVIRGHTHAPAIVIGERGADLIRGR